MVAVDDLRRAFEPMAALALWPLVIAAALRSDAMRTSPGFFHAMDRWLGNASREATNFGLAEEPFQGEDI